MSSPTPIEVLERSASASLIPRDRLIVAAGRSGASTGRADVISDT